MGDTMILELKDARGRVRTRTRVGAAPLTVGRALDNDIIVDDGYVDAHHLTLRLDESGLLVEDLGSINGSTVAGSPIRGASTIAEDGTAILIGRTTLVVRSLTAAVPPAQKMGGRITRSLTSSQWLSWGLAACALVLFCVYMYANDYQKFEPVEWMYSALGFAFLVAAWAGTWAIGGRIFASRSSFRAHMGFASLVMLIGFPITGVIAYAGELLPGSGVQSTLDLLFTMLVFWPVVLFGHIDIASQRSLKTKALITAGICLAFGGVYAAVNSIEDAHDADVATSLGAIRPLPAWLDRSTSLDRFNGQLADLQAQLEAEVLDVEVDE